MPFCWRCRANSDVSSSFVSPSPFFPHQRTNLCQRAATLYIYFDCGNMWRLLRRLFEASGNRLEGRKMHQDRSQLNSYALNIVNITQDLSSKTWGGVGERPAVMVTPGFSLHRGQRWGQELLVVHRRDHVTHKVTLPCDKRCFKTRSVSSADNKSMFLCTVSIKGTYWITHRNWLMVTELRHTKWFLMIIYNYV